MLTDKVLDLVLPTKSLQKLTLTKHIEHLRKKIIMIQKGSELCYLLINQHQVKHIALTTLIRQHMSSKRAYYNNFILLSNELYQCGQPT